MRRILRTPFVFFSVLFCGAFFAFVFVVFKTDSSYTGYIQPRYHYAAPTTSGILEELYVQDGQNISKGANLFSLNLDLLSLNIEQAQRELEKNIEILDFCEKEYERYSELWEKAAVSDELWQKTKKEYYVAKKNKEIAEISLLALVKKFEESRPLSPYAGVVQTHFYIPGDYVPAGSPVLSVHLPEEAKLIFYVPVQDKPKIFLGQSVQFRYEKKDGFHKAYISFIGANPEYTPPVIYSQNFQNSLSYVVEARVDSEVSQGVLGIPVEVRIHG